jgi:hypothetical protein
MKVLKTMHPLTWVLIVLIVAIIIIVMLGIVEGSHTWKTIVESSAAIIFGLTTAALHEMYRRRQPGKVPSNTTDNATKIPYKPHFTKTLTPSIPNIHPEDDDDGGLAPVLTPTEEKVLEPTPEEPAPVETSISAFADITNVAE